MGLLPITRVKPSPPFAVTGIDYAGPLLIRRGHARKPKAVYIELVSDLTPEAFLAALSRFTDRRGCPSTILSDNATNFVGANRELRDLQNLLTSKSTPDQIQAFSTAHRIAWKFSPSRSPHFGGLWEAGIKNMKMVLKKIAGPHHLTFQQLCTVLTAAECTLNSRPLLPVDSTSPDGMSPLTPGHFLIGRHLHSLPTRVETSKLTSLHHWELIKRLKSDIWTRWYTLYLQALQRRDKCQFEQLNLQPCGIVLLKEIDSGRTHWPLARILETYPGDDGCVRVVKIFCCGHAYKRAVQKLVPLVRRASHSASLPRSVSRPRCLVCDLFII